MLFKLLDCKSPRQGANMRNRNFVNPGGCRENKKKERINMYQKFLSLALALDLCLSLSTQAMAENMAGISLGHRGG